MEAEMEVWMGSPYPLGATYDGSGTNFALFSEAASAVHLCLFDEDGSEQRIRLRFGPTPNRRRNPTTPWRPHWP
jgi:glycogen operon protein